MEAFYLLGFIPMLVYLGLIVFAVFVVITIINLMKQRNEYLKDIRDELKKKNNLN